MKTPAEIHAQREMDEEILHFVREMHNTAPIRASSVFHYLKNVRRRKVLETDVELRLAYLCDKKYLKTVCDFLPGEGSIDYYEVTADGSDVLDGVKPWK